ncbi:FAD-binding oxidoreductase [Phycicoccus sp. Root101]|uniref:FAD-binding oxidoreductase n=1 Tax=Phycicoccus sp. Root101 TaxID=1736421 RepID=UPI000703937D|nr:FAD-binding oxidoreductase [Phycicoccus sp. Root101]KQU68948.1 hypothetical protein ASC58_09865 [Phycicoccus sp. Root101]
MARAAILQRLTWVRATLDFVRRETPSARTLSFTSPAWAGHRPGQHLDLRLTAPDGYAAHRPYSISSAPTSGRFELTVQKAPGGEVSPFLAEIATPGITVEFRGPLGGWFVWAPDQRGPVQLIAGGSGLAPLMSMIRTHRNAGHPDPMRLLYSTRSPTEMLFAQELAPAGQEVRKGFDATEATTVFTRSSPPESMRKPSRLSDVDLRRYCLAAVSRPLCYVCGPTPFVEAVVQILVAIGHDPECIRTERFGSESDE